MLGECLHKLSWVCTGAGPIDYVTELPRATTVPMELGSLRIRQYMEYFSNAMKFCLKLVLECLLGVFSFCFLFHKYYLQLLYHLANLENTMCLENLNNID